MRETLERQLFSWENWDEIDCSSFVFYDVVLKVPIGEFETGHKFQSAVFSVERSLLQLWEDDEVFHEFELKISVGDLIPKE